MKKLNREYGVLLFMVATTLLGKMLGLVRDMMIASSYGVTYEADAFFVASRIPNNFFDFALSAAIASTFIPIFNRIMKRDGKASAFVYTNQFITLTLAIATAVSVLLIVFSKQLVMLFSPGLAPETMLLASQLTRSMAPIVIFASITFTFTGLMQSFEHFNLPAAISIFSNVVVIGYLVLLNNRFGLHGLAIALTFGWFIQALVQMPMMRKEGFIVKPDFHWNTPDIKATIQMSIPILFTSWAQPITALVTTNLASRAAGGVSVMEYSTRVFIIISGVLNYSITNYIFPKLSKAYSGSEFDRFKSTINNSLIFFTYFSFPVVLLVIKYRLEIITILFERGAFSSDASLMTAKLLGILIIGLYGMGIKEILSRVYFSMGDTKTPMKITVFGIFITVPLSIALFSVWGLIGLATASTLSMIMISFIMFSHAWKNNYIGNVTTFLKQVIRIIIVDLILLSLSLLVPISPLQYAIPFALIIMIAISLAYLILHVLLLRVLGLNLPRIE